jgi:hypothetical protein
VLISGKIRIGKMSFPVVSAVENSRQISYNAGNIYICGARYERNI